jgi:TnpA family transposase
MPDLLRRATTELNKGEAQNALACAVYFHRLGRLHNYSASWSSTVPAASL